MITKLFETSVSNGLLGSFKIDDNGDPEDASGAVVGFTIYVATDELTTKTTSRPTRTRSRRHAASEPIDTLPRNGREGCCPPARFALESPRS